MTWLDMHLRMIGGAFERVFGRQEDGVRTGFIRMAETTMPSIPHDAGPETGKRFEVDLLPHVQPDLLRLSHCLRLQPDLTTALSSTELDGAQADRVEKVLSSSFVYVDLMPGSMPIGSVHEVRCVIVRGYTLLHRGGVRAPARMPGGPRFDAVFGRPGRPTRQRLSWQPPAMLVTQARVPYDPDYPSEAARPLAMLQGAGIDAVDVLTRLMRITVAAVDFAGRHQGTPRVVPVQTIPKEDPASHGSRCVDERSLLRIAELRA